MKIKKMANNTLSKLTVVFTVFAIALSSIISVSLSRNQTAYAAPPLNTCTAEQTRATQRYWYFGVNAGLDFGTSGTAAPTLTTGTGSSLEGTTVVTDSAGTLQFWSNGVTVYNRNQAVMQNGSGLTGNASATQTVAAFPSMTKPGEYFVVTTSANAGAAGQLRYSVVDMNQNGGLGAVTAKNVNLSAAGAASEALTAAPNSTGDGYWVLTHTYNSPNMLAYLFDGDGPADPDGGGPLNAGDPVVSVMPDNNGNLFGTLNFSADYTKLLLTTGFAGNGGPTTLRLLDFDAATGSMTQTFQWGLPTGTATGTNGYSGEFSPSGNYVYATKVFNTPNLLRYNLAGATTGAQVEATLEDLGNLGGGGGQVKRGPDGKMYIAQYNTQFLSTVSSPDAATAAGAGYSLNSVALAPAGSRFGLPQLVTGCYIPTASVGDGMVYNDGNNNGTYDAGQDAPIPNVTVALDGCDGGPDGVINTSNIPMTGNVTCAGDDRVVQKMTTTDVNGQYNFDQLYNGRYRLTQTQPLGYSDGQRTIGSVGGEANAVGTTPSVITNIVVDLEEAATGYDFAEIRHEVSITKTSSDPDVLTPGGTVNYTVTVTNEGDVIVPSVTLTDELPDTVTSATWTCTPSGGATCPNATGTGDLNEAITNLPVGGSLEYIIATDLASDLPDFVANTAILTGDDTTYCMPGGTPGPCMAVATNPPAPVIELSKIANVTQVDPGDEITWQIVARSANSNSSANGTTITDTMPNSVENVSWTCAADGGAVCPSSTGSGDINETIATFPSNSTVTYTVVAIAKQSARNEITNAVQANGTGTLCLPDFTGGPCATSSIISVIDPPALPPATSSPTNDNQAGHVLASTGANVVLFGGVAVLLVATGLLVYRFKSTLLSSGE